PRTRSVSAASASAATPASAAPSPTPSATPWAPKPPSPHSRSPPPASTRQPSTDSRDAEVSTQKHGTEQYLARFRAGGAAGSPAEASRGTPHGAGVARFSGGARRDRTRPPPPESQNGADGGGQAPAL